MKLTSKYFNAEGVIKLAPKQGKPPRHKEADKNADEIEICLNCTRDKCSGNCKKIEEHHTKGS